MKADTVVSASVVAWLIVASLSVVVGCNSIQSIGVTGSYGNDMVSVGVTIVFKESPSAETVAALEKANAVRIKSTPQEVWAMGNYNSENKAQVKAMETSLRDGATIERIE